MNDPGAGNLLPLDKILFGTQNYNHVNLVVTVTAFIPLQKGFGRKAWQTAGEVNISNL